jgi:hypothetical protein
MSRAGLGSIEKRHITRDKAPQRHSKACGKLANLLNVASKRWNLVHSDINGTATADSPLPRCVSRTLLLSPRHAA